MKFIFSFIVILLLILNLIPTDKIFAGNPPDAGHSTLTLNFNGSNQVSADGTSTVSIIITLKDSSGTVLTGDTVNLSASNTGANFNPSSSTLDANGNATFTMTSTNAVTDQINVVDTTTNTTLTNLGQVTFVQPTPTLTPSPSPTPTSAPGVCNNPTPGSAPKLTDAVSAGAHSVTLTWEKATNPVTYYLLAFGTTTGNYIYGSPNIGDQNTTSYTVGNLSTGRKYYFVIRAFNGCAPSSYSNEIVGTAGATATPTSPPDDPASNNDSIIDTGITDEIPTDTPEPQATPTETPVPNSNSGDNVGKIVLAGTAIGIMLLIGVGVWFGLSQHQKSQSTVKPFHKPEIPESKNVEPEIIDTKKPPPDIEDLT
jgi:hypothetical protein